MEAEMSASVVKDTHVTLTPKHVVTSTNVLSMRSHRAVSMPFVRIFLEVTNVLARRVSMETLFITARNATVLNAVVNHLTN